ncbi:MAG: S9 family peptidase, partial [Alphaproteobacteria bacterium]
MTKPTPPNAQRKDHSARHPGVTIKDPYNWLYDRAYPKVNDQDVLDYLKAENAYTEAVMAPYEDFTETLFQEMKGRIAEKDEGVPARDGPYFYAWRYSEGIQYKVWFRTPVEGGKEEIILDENARAKGKDYYKVGGISLSPDHKLMAWSEDISGAERFTYRIKDLAT